MSRKLVLYLTFRALQGSGYLQLERAQAFLGLNILLHVAQVALLVFPIDREALHISERHLLIGMVLFLAVLYVVSLVFNRRILGKSIVLYRNSKVTKWARPLVFGYFLVNILILIALSPR
ncbi:MAG: hypothetical protein EOP04_18845 [Proteobacteria bacterium]|nr:MAG: hypothetical protein EOP04_18845 [Pseudomonadota bacterium]